LSPAAAEGVILGGGFPLVLPVPHLAVLLLRLTLVVGGDLGERAGVCSATCVRGAFKVDALRDAVLRSSRMVSSKTLYFFRSRKIRSSMGICGNFVVCPLKEASSEQTV